MATSNHFEQENEKIEKTLEDSPNELSFMPVIQNGSFFNNDNYNFEHGMNSPLPDDLPPSNLFPTLTNAVEEEVTDILYVFNAANGRLEEAESSYLQNEVEGQLQTIDEEETYVLPSKRQKKEKISLYEESLLKEHDMRMKLWDLELQANQQEHALKMKILKEKLEKIQQEKEILQRERNAKYLGKFSSGPI